MAKCRVASPGIVLAEGRGGESGRLQCGVLDRIYTPEFKNQAVRPSNDDERAEECLVTMRVYCQPGAAGAVVNSR